MQRPCGVTITVTRLILWAWVVCLFWGRGFRGLQVQGGNDSASIKGLWSLFPNPFQALATAAAGTT